MVQKEDKMDIKLEFRRQIAHMLLGLAVIYVYLFTNISPFWLLGLGVISEILFLINKRMKLPFVDFLVQKFERRDDIDHFPGRGFITFMLGCALTLMAFRKDIAFAAILVLSFGDSVSNLVGKTFGQIYHSPWLSPHKTIEGSFAGWLVAFNLAMFFVSPLEALVAASLGMMIEVIEIRHKWVSIEDNLTIPLFAGLGVYALRLLTGT
jgi:dolichol kinase